jgi:hypothetical protein
MAAAGNLATVGMRLSSFASKMQYKEYVFSAKNKQRKRRTINTGVPDPLNRHSPINFQDISDSPLYWRNLKTVHCSWPERLSTHFSRDFAAMRRRDN